MPNRFLFDEPDKSRWMDVRGTKPTKSGRIESPLKWAGSKGKDHYINPLQRSVLMAGADRLIDPMMGGANIPLNMPVKEVLAADRDKNLVNAMQHIQGGIEVPWHEFTGHGIDESAVTGGKAREQVATPGEISKPTFFGDLDTFQGRDFSTYTGPTLRGSTKDPQEGSLNHLLDMANRGELGDDGYRRLAQLWLMVQQAGFNAHTRSAGGEGNEHRYSMTRGAAGPFADVWNYRHYQPKMKDWSIEAMPVDEFLSQLESKRKGDLLTIDPPYEGEQAGYGNKFDMESGQQQALARKVGELAEDGMNVVAFNSPLVADLYRDQGFQTMLNRRMDSSGAKASSRGIKPEMIATNIPGMDADEWFRNHPDKRFEGTAEEQQAWEEQFGEAFNPDDWVGKAKFFPDEIDPQGLIRRSIVNDLTELADIMMKAVAPDEMPDYMNWWKDLSVPTGGESGTKVAGKWNSGNMDLINWLKANDHLVQDHITDDAGNPRLMDIPLDADYEIPEWEDVRDNLDYKGKPEKFGHYGKPSKMAGGSMMDSPPRACVFATRDNPNSACGHCYACNHNYKFNSTQAALWRNYDRMIENPEEVASAYSLTATARAMLDRTSKRDKPVARIWAAGDGLGPGAYAAADKIAEDNPMTDFWGSTRQLPFLQEFLDARGHEDLAPNLALKVSLPGIMTTDNIKPGTEYQGVDLHELGKHPAIDFTTYDSIAENDPNFNICPATLAKPKQKKCDQQIDPMTGEMKCRACYRRGNTIGYADHDDPLSKYPPSLLEHIYNTRLNPRRIDEGL
jgi:site-specific DNA-adenine methylase